MYTIFDWSETRPCRAKIPLAGTLSKKYFECCSWSINRLETIECQYTTHYGLIHVNPALLNWIWKYSISIVSYTNTQFRRTKKKHSLETGFKTMQCQWADSLFACGRKADSCEKYAVTKISSLTTDVYLWFFRQIDSARTLGSRGYLFLSILMVRGEAPRESVSGALSRSVYFISGILRMDL